MRHKIVLAAALAVAVQLLPGTARAGDAGNSATVATGSTYCVTESVLLRNDTSQAVKNMYSRGTVRSFRPDCDSERERPVQHLAETLYVYFQKTLSSPVALCKYTDWSYNPEPAFALRKVMPASAPLCGPGYYNVTAYGYTWENNAWHGDGVDSGWLYIN